MPSAVSLTAYLRLLQLRLAHRTTESPEASLADLVPDLIRSLADAAGRPGIDLRGQAHEATVGRPDFSVKQGALLIGHVETKAPGAGADVERFRGAHDRDQWKRFRNLPNVLYTDGTAFALYRSGLREGRVLQIAFDASDSEQEAAAADAADLVALLTRFLSWRAVAPTSLSALAEQLAPLCAVLRDEARAQLDRSSEVAKAAAEFEDALFPDRSRDEVADAFAQVCTYSMLLARAGGADDLRAATIEATLRNAHPVLARVVRVLLDDQTERELGWALDTVRTLIEVVDFDRLRRGRRLPGMTHEDQTWLYFYEAFLARYDPRLRDQYGVYYTPQQVIHGQVALVEDVLRRQFGMAQGLASPDVTVLDPAVGTGSYPIQVIQAAAAAAERELGAAAVAGAVRGLAANLYAFEVLVGPYAVAHLRLWEVVEELGGHADGAAVNVYLTDTLSSPYAEPAELTRLLDPLVDEQRRALQVKSGTRVLVCLGNPPYERGPRVDASGAQSGGWVVHGDGQRARPLFEDFLQPARAAGHGGHLKNLYNEYVYFWRWALWKVFERGHEGSASEGPGLVSFITASSYLAGPGFTGMREHLRRTCDELWIIDLGGEGRGARREQNVFAIQTPVAIALAVRSGPGARDAPARVRYCRVSGDRATKLRRMAELTGLEDLEWQECSTGWGDAFLPRQTEAWSASPAATDLFPWQHSGAQAKRTWPIAPDRDVLARRWSALLRAPDRRAALRETRDRTVASTPKALTGDERPQPIERLPDDAPAPPVVRYGYRVLDRQWVIADARLADFPRPELWRSLSERQIFMVSFLTAVLDPGPAAVATAYVPDLHHFRGSFGGRHVIPLYTDANATPNLAPGTLEWLRSALGTEVEAEDVFAYAYGVLSSQRYTERFFDELRRPGPRLPVTASTDLFVETAALGRRMLWLHTYGQRMTAPDRPKGAVPRGAATILYAVPTTAEGFPREFLYDEPTRELRIGTGVVGPVEPELWRWSVSGLRVVSSWLAYRMRDGAGRAKSSTSPLDRLRPEVWPARYTTELLELLWVLEATLDAQPRQTGLVDAVCEGPLLAGVDA